MKNYIGLVISVENYHDSKNLRKVKFASNDAIAFIENLGNLGSDKSKLQYLPDNIATKTTIEERIKDISKNATSSDIIIFYYAGHGFYYNGKNLISCVDTSLSSLETTTIEINSIIAALDKSKSNKVIAFLDCCHSGIEFSEIERSPVSGFSTDELKYEYNNAEHLTVFASCKSDEKSQADTERQHGVWSYYLLEALSGNAKGIYDGAILFSDKLQKYLGENTFQRVKMITADKKNQTPVKFGKETTDKFIVADLSKIFEEREIKKSTEGIRFETATILTSEDGWVRNLPGFKSSHKLPKEISSHHDNWIKSISKELIEEELNQISNELRQKLKYKRKDIYEPIIDGGSGQLSTVDFDYIVTINQSKKKADTYVLTKSIENFKNGAILNNPEFNQIFKDSFDELELWLNKKLDIESIIDKIEEIDNEDTISVDYERTNTNSCRIKVNGFSGEIILTGQTFKILMHHKNSPQNLVLSCQNAYQKLGHQGVQKMLNE
ncbi:hypothetical protein C1637_14105 [Chryseobacterium lactis]|uniref:Peptidase C14 caspase domain-containing protein n=1 Tax=Chryseobacterium lactis TaxID=1241981 RepID=A0A3G6RGG6_CHRLC|nr:caspase family protein [Chryseobacterium lactis]AZA83746.1 hypothetical protein EG342_18460 [Chryseobacterium lactis]AZB04131.1 hypothetical protein EG341_09335 [Chryseobacterium lactis]PNW12961.1 hypothetical protein C1637_14105 [Chryseobacterium lactis]